MENLFIRRSYFDALRDMSYADRLTVWDAICGYAFAGVVPDSMPEQVADQVSWILRDIDLTRAHYQRCVENGKKGGRPRKKSPS